MEYKFRQLIGDKKAKELMDKFFNRKDEREKCRHTSIAITEEGNAKCKNCLESWNPFSLPREVRARYFST